MARHKPGMKRGSRCVRLKHTRAGKRCADFSRRRR